MKFGFDWPSGFGEEDRTDNGRTDDGPWLYYKLTNEPKGSGELKIHKKFGSHNGFLTQSMHLKSITVTKKRKSTPG